MTWIAVRTKPGAQLPQRQFVVQHTRSRKGYRINAELYPDVSAVERALTDAGFIHWMPAEKRLIRDRKRTAVYRGRRFALMVGYVFVQDPHDWRALEEVEGVAHIVKDIGGKPLAIPLKDLLVIRSMEAIAEEQFDRDSKRSVSILKAKAKRNPTLRKLMATLEAASASTVPVQEALAA